MWWEIPSIFHLKSLKMLVEVFVGNILIRINNVGDLSLITPTGYLNRDISIEDLWGDIVLPNDFNSPLTTTNYLYLGLVISHIIMWIFQRYSDSDSDFSHRRGSQGKTFWVKETLTMAQFCDSSANETDYPIITLTWLGLTWGTG